MIELACENSYWLLAVPYFQKKDRIIDVRQGSVYFSGMWVVFFKINILKT